MRDVRRFPCGLVILAVATIGVGAARGDAGAVSVRSVEALEGEQTIVKIHLSRPLATPPTAHRVPRGGGLPERLAVDLPGADMNGKPPRAADVGWGGLRRMRLATPDASRTRLVLELDGPRDFDLATEGDVVQITLRPARGASK